MKINKNKSKSDKTVDVLFETWLKKLKQKGIYFNKNKKELSVRWVTGGISGGSCWGDGKGAPYYSREGELEPDFADLEKIFEEYWPDISYIKFREFYRDKVKFDSDYEKEYYGNSTNYGIKSVSLYDVFDFLSVNKKIPCE